MSVLGTPINKEFFALAVKQSDIPTIVVEIK